MPQPTFEKRALIDGVGNLFLNFMETEETSVTPPTYAPEVFETPSIDTVEMAIESSSRDIFLSNLLHDQLENVTAVTLTVNAGYFPTGFAEEAQGMENDGAGAWSLSTNPTKKPFRLAFPATDMNDDEIIFIFPKCTLAPTGQSFQTRRDERQEQIPSYDVRGIPLVYRATGEKRRVYHRIDLTTEEAKAQWDRAKLLTEPIYDRASLNATKSTVTP